MAADAIHEGLARASSRRRISMQHERQRHAVMSFRRLVSAFYDLTFSFREFLQVYPHLQSLIVDTLVGNVFADLTPLFTALEEYSARQARVEIDVTTA
jgi:hypothetical protein